MNTDYVIQIKTKTGRIWTYRQEKNGWSEGQRARKSAAKLCAS
jgi:hypothetical protein